MAQPFRPAQRAYHWISAALILALAASGMLYFWEIADGAAIRVHQVIGQFLIVLLAGRLLAKFRAGRRAADLSHALWERLLAGCVQIALYAAMIVAVVTGYVSASALRENMLLLPVDLAFARSDIGETMLETHYLMKWVLLGLVTLHISGALKHHFIDRDDTLRNMLPTK